MRRLLIGLLLTPAGLAAQEGAIVFNYAVQFEFEVPERLRERMGDMEIPNSSNTSMILLFDESESVMLPVPEEAPPEAVSPERRRMEGMMMRMRMGSPQRANQETMRGTYTNFEQGAVTETREFMGRTFLIQSDRPSYEWTLSGDQREFMGYVVMKATTEHEGSSIEAWFTPQIPVQGGPGSYGGLPGMILVLTVDAGKTVYSAMDVDLSTLGDGVIRAPGDGDMISREEYEAMVAEKLEELRTERSRRGDRRRPF